MAHRIHASVPGPPPATQYPAGAARASTPAPTSSTPIWPRSSLRLTSKRCHPNTMAPIPRQRISVYPRLQGLQEAQKQRRNQPPMAREESLLGRRPLSALTKRSRLPEEEDMMALPSRATSALSDPLRRRRSPAQPPIRPRAPRQGVGPERGFVTAERTGTFIDGKPQVYQGGGGRSRVLGYPILTPRTDVL
jgi:hypothetical protein